MPFPLAADVFTLLLALDSCHCDALTLRFASVCCRVRLLWIALLQYVVALLLACSFMSLRRLDLEVASTCLVLAPSAVNYMAMSLPGCLRAASCRCDALILFELSQSFRSVCCRLDGVA